MRRIDQPASYEGYSSFRSFFYLSRRRRPTFVGAAEVYFSIDVLRTSNHVGTGAPTRNRRRRNPAGGSDLVRWTGVAFEVERGIADVRRTSSHHKIRGST